MNDVIEFPTVFVCHQGPRLQEICQDPPYSMGQCRQDGGLRGRKGEVEGKL